MDLNLMQMAYHAAPETDASLRAKREKAGRCANCNAQTHRVSLINKKTPLDIPGEVHRGRCLRCYPIDNGNRRINNNNNNNNNNCPQAVAAAVAGMHIDGPRNLTETRVETVAPKVGDVVPPSVAISAASVIKSRLEVNDAAFLKRSDGRWTYAVVEKVQPRMPQTFVFQVDPNKAAGFGATAISTKEFTESMFSMGNIIRSVPNYTAQDYQLGDVVQPSDLNAASAVSTSMLNINDAAFIQRSNGSWTYAILYKINPPTPPTLVFALDQNINKSIKSVPESEWATMLRCAVPPLPPLPPPISPPQAVPTASPDLAKSMSLNIGDVAPNDMRKKLETGTYIAAAQLKIGDAAFVKRTDGRWTYAIVQRIDPGPSLVFHVEANGHTGIPSEKSFPEGTWETHVRCIPVTTDVSVSVVPTKTVLASQTYMAATTPEMPASYMIGDIVRQEDVDRAPLAVDCQLKAGDTAIVQRSNGSWTYAVVERLEGDNNTSGVPQQPQQRQSLVCRVSTDGLPVMTKSFLEETWASSVRSIPSLS